MEGRRTGKVKRLVHVVHNPTEGGGREGEQSPGRQLQSHPFHFAQLVRCYYTFVQRYKRSCRRQAARFVPAVLYSRLSFCGVTIPSSSATSARTATRLPGLYIQCCTIPNVQSCTPVLLEVRSSFQGLIHGTSHYLVGLGYSTAERLRRVRYTKRPSFKELARYERYSRKPSF